METLFLAGAAIELDDDRSLTVTTYPTGDRIPALPQANEEYRARAKALGYGDDAARMSREHEVLHSLLASWIGLPHSPTLHGVAHGKHWEHWKTEEAAVLAIAAFANAAGVDLMHIARSMSRQPSYE